jgi:hypothetical protein
MSEELGPYDFPVEVVNGPYTISKEDMANFGRYSLPPPMDPALIQGPPDPAKVQESSVLPATEDSATTKPANTSKNSDTNFLSDVLASGISSGISNYLASDYSSVPSGMRIVNQGSASGSGGSAGSSILNSSPNVQNTNKDNILHSYVNPTYRISLWAVRKETINQIYSGGIVNNPKAIISGGECIIADSGINKSKRSTDFPVDMGIDNLELETIVGTGARTRGTDVIQIKFDIIEPYTAVLFARMRKLNARFNPNGGWNTMFFVMQIEWYAYDDSGHPAKIDRTRYIPFKFINMKMKVTSSGAVYNCTALPVNGSALDMLDNTIPFHVELQGTTVKDVFNAATASFVNQTTGGTRDSNTTTTNGVTGGNAGTSTTINKGLAEALNNAQKELCRPENNGQKLPNKFEFEFDSSLESAKIATPSKFKEQSLAMSTGKGATQQQAVAAGKAGSLTLDTNKDVFRAQSGTKITDLINSVLSVSDYMTNQWKPGGNDNSTPLNMWKIIPTIKYGEIDPSTNYYQRTIKYTVIPYSLKGQDAPNFPGGVPSDNEVLRSYNYIFTGQNKDVISVDLDFKMSFFEVRNGAPTNAVKWANDAPNPDQPKASGPLQSKTTGGFKPRYHFAHGIASRQNTGATAETYASIDVQNLMEKIFDNGVDLLHLNIEIVGDPDWISQDYMLYGPKAGNGPRLADNSINFAKEQYFDFFFFSPSTDYNDSSGLFGADGDYADFSGRYRVISVKSKFAGGKFTQTLKNVRLRNQTATTSGSVRSDQPNTTNIGSTGSDPYTSGLGGNPVAYGVIGSTSTRAKTLGLGGSILVGAASGAIGGLINNSFYGKVPAGAKSGSIADSTITAPNTTTTNTGSKPNTQGYVGDGGTVAAKSQGYIGDGSSVPSGTSATQGYVGDGGTVVSGSQGYVGDGSTSGSSKSQGYVGDGTNDPKVIDTTTIGNGGYNPNEPASAGGKTFINDKGEVESLETTTNNTQYWEQTPAPIGYSEDFAYNGSYGDFDV